ncbi:hypothetical protein [Adhaeretor mobilis]|uniref:Uncharacterized protein n=1 Tax=Adhaeretor mobilis TaxID=1930276 RepID=A0A517N0M3_9BACT|nr:hypothetical protein [Adhaeretor mobilis]QDT00654.1 hypothetical protein HG15A2_39930 [Adhaeretor mobilis]
MKTILSVLALAAACCVTTTAQAQVVTYYRPTISPVMAPRAVYYAPAPAPVRTVSYYAPVVEPVVAPVVYEPAVRVRQRYRPILGGTVTRVRHGYVPSVYPIVRY